MWLEKKCQIPFLLTNESSFFFFFLHALQIFVATTAFLLPSAEHSTAEADKKVHGGKEMAEIWRTLIYLCWNGAFKETCFHSWDLFSCIFHATLFGSFLPPTPHFLFFNNVLFSCFFVKYFNFLSWWCPCCYVCWTGAWLFPWVCFWNRLPQLCWRTTHPSKPPYWTTSTGWVVSPSSWWQGQRVATLDFSYFVWDLSHLYCVPIYCIHSKHMQWCFSSECLKWHSASFSRQRLFKNDFFFLIMFLNKPPNDKRTYLNNKYIFIKTHCSKLLCRVLFQEIL